MNVAAIAAGIATLAWIGVIVVVGLTVVRASRGQSYRGSSGLIVGMIVLALLASGANQAIMFVQPTERGVVISALPGREGVRPDPLQPGLNFVVPLFENVELYTITRQTYTMSIAPQEGQIVGDDSVEARTSDGQVVRVDASVIFSINPSGVVATHIKWQGRYVDNLIRPQARGVIRDAVSQFGVEEVYSTERFALAAQIDKDLRAAMEEGGLIMHDFVLRNIAFSPEYAASVEQKQIAEQLAQQAAFIVQQREQEAQQAIKTAEGQKAAAILEAEGLAQARLIQARAEKEALELIASALRDNPDLLIFEYIQKLSPGIQVMLIPSDNPFLLPIPRLEGSSSIDLTPLPDSSP